MKIIEPDSTFVIKNVSGFYFIMRPSISYNKTNLIYLILLIY